MIDNVQYVDFVECCVFWLVIIQITNGIQVYGYFLIKECNFSQFTIPFGGETKEGKNIEKIITFSNS